MIILQPQNTEENFDISGTLPSGDVYAAFESLSVGDKTPVKADFSYKISGNISFSIKAEALPGIVQARNIQDQAGFEDYSKKLAGEISDQIKKEVLSTAGQEKSFETLLEQGSSQTIRAKLLASYPFLDNLSISFQTIKLPDFSLYSQAASLYQKYIDYQVQSLDQSLAGTAKEQINNKLRIDELTQYGELLSKYPQLLDYLKLNIKQQEHE
jgi:hypothetical protein